MRAARINRAVARNTHSGNYILPRNGTFSSAAVHGSIRKEDVKGKYRVVTTVKKTVVVKYRHYYESNPPAEGESFHAVAILNRDDGMEKGEIVPVTRAPDVNDR